MHDSVARRRLAGALLVVGLWCGVACAGSGSTFSAIVQDPAPAAGQLEDTMESPWPKFRGNLQNTGQVDEPSIERPKVLWKRDLGAPVSGSPVIGPDGRVYIATEPGRLYCLDGETGAVVKDRDGQFMPGMCPALFGRDLYVSTFGGIKALRDLDLRTEWRFPTPLSTGLQRGAGVPTMLGDLVMVGSFNGSVYALDRQTGRQVWKFKTHLPPQWAAMMFGVVGCPAVSKDGKHVYFGASDARVYALDAGSGQLEWSHPIGADVSAPVAVGSDNTIYAAGWTGTGAGLVALDGRTGEEKWRFSPEDVRRLDTLAASSPALWGGMVYVGSLDGSLYAVDASTGKLRWSLRTGGEVTSSPAIAADGTLYVGSHNGNLYAVDGRTGQVRWKYHSAGPIYSSPAIGRGGVVYFGSSSHGVYALK